MIIRKNHNPKNNCIFESLSEKIRYWDTETSDKELDKNPHLKEFSLLHGGNFTTLKIKSPIMTFLMPSAIVACRTSKNDIIGCGKDYLDQYEALNHIKLILGKSPKLILAAHNGDNFDIKLLAASYYQVCIPPYEFKYGIRTLDTKEIIKNANFWGLNDFMYDPKTSKWSWSIDKIVGKITDQKSAAHNAEEDVKLLSEIIINLIKEHPYIGENIIHNYAVGTNTIDKPFLLIDSNYQRGTESYLALPLGPHKEWKNYSLCAVLNPNKINIYRPNEIKNLSNISVRAFKQKNIAIYWPSWSKKFNEVFPNLPLNEIENIIQKNRDHLIENYEKKLKKPIVSRFEGNFTPGTFFSENDSLISQKFHQANPKEKNQFTNSFDDENLNYNAKLTMFRYWPDFMDSKDSKYVFEKELSYLESKESKKTPRITYEDLIQDFDKQLSSKILDKVNKETLEWYQERVLALRANPNLWRVKND